MNRINGAGHVNHMFVSEDPATNRPPTEVTMEWLNGIQEELVALIEEQGLVPSDVDLAQVGTAIKRLLQKSAPVVAAAGGTADAITAAYTPAIAALTDGMTLCVRAGSANATTMPTFTPANGTIPAKAIVKSAGAALAAGDIAGAGHWIELQYDQTVDKWVLRNPATGVSGAPVGSLLYVHGASAPGGYLKANGAAVSRTVYAALYAKIGATYGAGDGSTTFNVPDLRGEFIRGLDDGRGVDTGRALGSAQVDAFKAHTHTYTRVASGGGSAPDSGATGSYTALATGSTGDSETRPRNLALLVCIKY